jgi:hypothetical protein
VSSSAGIHHRAPAMQMPPTELLSLKFELQVVTCPEPIVCSDLPSLLLPYNPVPNQISAVSVSVDIVIVEIEEAAVQFFHSLLASTLFRWFVVARAPIEGIN